MIQMFSADSVHSGLRMRWDQIDPAITISFSMLNAKFKHRLLVDIYLDLNFISRPGRHCSNRSCRTDTDIGSHGPWTIGSTIRKILRITMRSQRPGTRDSGGCGSEVICNIYCGRCSGKVRRPHKFLILPYS